MLLSSKPLLAARVFGILLVLSASVATAQYPGNIRLTSPIGRTVLEVRSGTQPDNPRLLFTAAVTAGPTGGTTSLLLHQQFIADIFNPAIPAAGWVTVRSSTNAYSLGGGCGRNNLIDFPFINGSRPEIIRVTGTSHQVITLPITENNDQYDSITCITEASGRVLYMLTNRTRSRLEMRREQGGRLALVRDNFGTVVTPFAGGIRPSIRRGFRPSVPGAERAPSANSDFYQFFYNQLAAPVMQETDEEVYANDLLTFSSACVSAAVTPPSGFTFPKESSGAGGVAVGPSRNDNLFWANFFSHGDGGCTLTQSPESLGSTGPFSLFTWGGVTANRVSGNVDGSDGISTAMVLPNQGILIDGAQRTTFTSPFAGRGGPVTGCPLVGAEIESGALFVGVGPNATQVQHSTVGFNLATPLFRSSMEDRPSAVANCDQ